MVSTVANDSTQNNAPAESSMVHPEKEIKTISCRSQLLTEKFSHTWKMTGFNEIPFMSRYPLYSPSFALGIKSESLWQVVMTKHTYWVNKEVESDMGNDEGDSDSDDDYLEYEEVEIIKVLKKEKKGKESISEDNAEEESEFKPERMKRLGLRLVKVDDNTTWDVVKYTFTLKTPDGFTVTTGPREEPGSSDFEGEPMYAYLTEKDFGERDLFNESNIDVICDIVYKYVEGNPFESPEICEGKKFAADLRLLYNSKKFSDILLVVQGAELPAHKSVLCARAYEFDNLLVEDKDTPKQKLDLRVDAEVGNAMINFLYSGKISDNFPLEKCLSLYEAAHTYGVTSLKKYCSRYFKANLDAEVCRECLGLREQFDDYMHVIKKLGVSKVKRILSKEKCSHKSPEIQIPDIKIEENL